MWLALFLKNVNVADILQMISPQLMDLMIEFIDNKQHADDHPDHNLAKEPEWRAYFYPILILLTTLLQTIISAHQCGAYRERRSLRVCSHHQDCSTWFKCGSKKIC